MSDHESPGSIPGRGAGFDPPNRFEKLAVEREEWWAPGDPGRDTEFLADCSRSIIARNDSPDVGFDASLNPYRGCEHGCIYCYSRPGHEYLGFSAGLDFETRIVVKKDAARLLREALSAPRWRPRPLLMSGVTDPYQPVERHLRITRACLEVLASFRNPVAAITKSFLITRDSDILADLASDGAAAAVISITTLDRSLHRMLEPRASVPERRLAAIEHLVSRGVPVGVNVAPVIPGLTEHEVPRILKAAADAGASSAAYIMLRLPYSVAPLFEDWLERHCPDRKAKVLGRIRELRGGLLNDPRFRTRMRGEGPWAEHVNRVFKVACRRASLRYRHPALSAAAFRRPDAAAGSALGGKPGEHGRAQAQTELFG
jgi:DNA repair photolyase